MRPRIALSTLASALACTGCITPTGPNGTIQVATTDYPGGAKAFVLRNPYVEATVVPSLGRVMRFNFIGGESVLWENPALLGKPTPSKPWDFPGSYGGDKTWPAPQSQWNWPPPPAFDSLPNEARVDGNAVVLTTPVDTRTGIRAERRVMLNPYDPVMRIVTTYEKVQGDPVEVSVWVISQFRDPVGAYFRVPPNTRFPQGYNTEWGVPTNHVTVQGGIVKMTRDTQGPHKIGSDAPSLLWVGREQMCLVEVGRTAGARYPDSGSSVEIYTNPNPADYVEMETLGPLQTLRVGERLTAVNSYTLKRRNRTDPDADVRPVLPH